MPAVHWTSLGLWLLLCQAGLLGCEAYRSSSYHYYGTTGLNTQNGASTYNFQRQIVGPPNVFSNATLYCGLFSMSYATSCKFGSVDAYVTSESAVCNENMQSNCTRQASYASLSCSGFVCSRNWNYNTFLESVCLVLQPTDPLLPAVCDVQIRGQYIAPVIQSIAKALGIAVWKVIVIAVCGFIGVVVFVMLIMSCCAGSVSPTVIVNSFRMRSTASQPYIVELTVAEQASQDLQAKQNWELEQFQTAQAAGQGPQITATYPGSQTPFPPVGSGAGLQDPRLNPVYMPGPYQPSFMPPQDMQMGNAIGIPAYPAAVQQQEQLQTQLQQLQQQEQQLHMQVQLQQLQLQEQQLHQQQQELQQQLGESNNAQPPQGYAPPAQSVSTSTAVYQPPGGAAFSGGPLPATWNPSTSPSDGQHPGQPVTPLPAGYQPGMPTASYMHQG